MFIKIDGRSFLMGSDDGADDEKPVHRVWVDAFEIAATAVTNKEYAAFATPPRADDPNFNHPDQPVVAVSWLDAMAYCRWLGSFRLPTEAEWECAARGGLEGRRYPWGDDPPPARALAGPEKVAQRTANGFGLYDMCENVHEWCSDWYSNRYYSVSPDRNPPGPETGTRRASRGGSWRHQIQVSRCAARSSIPPVFCYTDYGFRVARDGASIER